MKRMIKFISICLVMAIMCASSVLHSSATVVIDGDTVTTEEMTFEKSEGLILDENLLQPYIIQEAKWILKMP